MESARPKRRRLKGFTSYFKEKRRKEQEEKEQKLREAEESLKVLLRPHDLSEAQQDRLRQLKRYKDWKRIQQRQQERYALFKSENKSVTTSNNSRGVPNVAVVVTPLSFGNQEDDNNNYHGAKDDSPFMDALHHHTWAQRVAVVTTLLVLLFISLHSELIAKRLLPEALFVSDQEAVWWVCVIKDCGRFWQMSLCALIHFALCDISLIYAFESLELGIKTGPKVKKFYRDQVHVAIAALSGGMVAFSILWALLMAWLRVIWSIVDMITELGRDSVAAVMHFVHSCVSLVHLTFQSSWVFLKSIPIMLYTTAPSDIASAPRIRSGWELIKSAAVAIYTTPPSELVSSMYKKILQILTGIAISIMATLFPFDREEGSVGYRLLSRFGNINNIMGVEDSLIERDQLAADPIADLNSTLNATSDGVCNTTLDWDSIMSLNATMNSTLEGAVNATMNTTTRRTLMNVTDSDAVPDENSQPIHLNWTEEAFETCRYLLSHSAIFLLVVLVGLNFLMKSYRHNNKNREKEPMMHTVPSSHSPSSTTPTPTTTPRQQRSSETATSALYPPADIELMSTNTYSTARPTTITMSVSTSSVSSNEEGRPHDHHKYKSSS